MAQSEREPGKIRAVVVDDEPLARSSLKVLLRDDPEIELVSECGSGTEALRETSLHLEGRHPDGAGEATPELG